MSFNIVTIGSKTYNSVGSGKYMLSTVTFGDARDYIQISGGSFNPKTGLTSAAVTRVYEKRFLDGQPAPTGTYDETKRMTVQFVVQVPFGFTAGDVDSSLKMLSDWVTGPTLERLLQGEQ